MRVMVFVKATQESEAGAPPDPKMMEEMGKFNEELMKAGVLLALDGLRPSSQGKRVRFSRSGSTVIDGPFAESKELIAGYWILQVRSMEEAVEWVKRCPCSLPGQEMEIEIRRIYEMEDLGMPEELTEHKKRARAKLPKQTR